jgi:hypothetical protein
MCELHGGFLAHIETAAEQSIMKGLLQRQQGHLQVLKTLKVKQYKYFFKTM